MCTLIQECKRAVEVCHTCTHGITFMKANSNVSTQFPFSVYVSKHHVLESFVYYACICEICVEHLYTPFSFELCLRKTKEKLL